MRVSIYLIPLFLILLALPIQASPLPAGAAPMKDSTTSAAGVVVSWFEIQNDIVDHEYLVLINNTNGKKTDVNLTLLFENASFSIDDLNDSLSLWGEDEKEWKTQSSSKAEKPNDKSKRRHYGIVSLKKDEELWFKVSFKTPITKTAFGWGSAGLVGFEINGTLAHPWWDANWKHRINVTLNETNGTNRNSEVINATVNFPSGQIKTGCGDFRVVADFPTPNSVPYNITSCSSTSVSFYFLADCSAGQTRQYWAYFGNPDATPPTENLSDIAWSSFDEFGSCTGLACNGLTSPFIESTLSCGNSTACACGDGQCNISAGGSWGSSSVRPSVSPDVGNMTFEYSAKLNGSELGLWTQDTKRNITTVRSYAYFPELLLSVDSAETRIDISAWASNDNFQTYKIYTNVTANHTMLDINGTNRVDSNILISGKPIRIVSQINLQNTLRLRYVKFWSNNAHAFNIYDAPLSFQPHGVVIGAEENSFAVRAFDEINFTQIYANFNWYNDTTNVSQFGAFNASFEANAIYNGQIDITNTTYYGRTIMSNGTDQVAYMLPLTYGSTIFTNIFITNIQGQSITNALITIKKQINGTWTIVAQGRTDDSGSHAFYLDSSVQHEFIVNESGCPYFSKSIAPTSTQYTFSPCVGSYNYTYVNVWTNLTYGLTPSLGTILCNETTNFNYTINLTTNELEWFSLRVTNSSGSEFFLGNETTIGGGNITYAFTPYNNQTYIDVMLRFKRTNFTEYYELHRYYITCFNSSYGNYTLVNALNELKNVASPQALGLFVIMVMVFFGGFVGTNLNKHAAVLTMIVVLGAFVYLQWVSVAYLIFAGSIVFAMIVTRWL